jgi:hypothetical protein
MRTRFSLPTIALLAAFVSYAPNTSAQSSQPDSVAEAARRAREQKKAAARPAPVITDDTFKPASAKPAVETPQRDASTTGAPLSAGSDQSQPAGATKPSDAAEVAARKKAEHAALKQQVEDKQKEVDIAKREFGLESETYYSKPDFSHDREGKARIDAMQTALKQQQDELATLKAKLAAAAAEDPDSSKTEAPKP